MKLVATLLLALVLTAVGTALACPQGALADGEQTLAGRLVNGTSGGPVPAGVGVALHVISPSGGVNTSTSLTGSDGGFAVEMPATDEGSTYALATVYQGVEYGEILDLPLPAEPLTLTVYETTADMSLLRIDSDVYLVKAAQEGGRTLSGSEVVSLSNMGDRTFVPDLSEGSAGMMSFLRFSLPPDATGLRVDSDLSGGEVLNVGAGFAVTSPVPPGRYLLGFSYTFPYDGDAVEFTRTFHLPTGPFRLWLSESLGEVHGSGLVPTEPTSLGETTYRVWQGGPFPAGAKLAMEFTGLPQPPWYERLGDTLFHGLYPKVVLLTFLGLALGGLMAYGLLRSPGRKIGATAEEQQGSTGPPLDRSLLVGELADLDEAYERSVVPPEEYRAQREALKARLLGLLEGRSIP